jgi:hypothetical protein
LDDAENSVSRSGVMDVAEAAIRAYYDRGEERAG